MPKTSGWQISSHPCLKHPNGKKLSFMPKTSGWQKVVVHAQNIRMAKSYQPCSNSVAALMCFQPVLTPTAVGNQRNSQTHHLFHLLYHQSFHQFFLFWNHIEVQFIVNL